MGKDKKKKPCGKCPNKGCKACPQRAKDKKKKVKA